MKNYVVTINVSCDLLINANDKEEADYIATNVGTVQIDSHIIYPQIKKVWEIEDINKYKKQTISISR